MCVGGATRGRVGSRRGITRSARCRRPRRSCAGRPCPPSSARPGSRKDLGERPTKGFGRRLYVSIACLFWVGRRRQPALCAQRWSQARAVPCHPDCRRRCDGNRRRAPRICARLHNLRHRAHARAATALSLCCVPMSLIVTRHHPTITTLVVLGARLRPAPLWSGRIGGLGLADRAPLVPVATCPKIQLPNLQGLGGPSGRSLVTQNKQSLLTGREVRDAE